MLLPESYRAWEHLLQTLRTGRTGYQIAYNASLWELLGRDPEYANRFNRAMVATSEEVAEFVAAGSDFSKASLIVDVGGANGALVSGGPRPNLALTLPLLSPTAAPPLVVKIRNPPSKR